MFDSAIHTLNQGGPVVWILMAMSLLASTIIVVKSIQLWHPHTRQRTNGHQAWALLAEGKRSEALVLIKGCKTLRAQLLTSALSLLDQERLNLGQQRDEVVRLARLQLLRLAGGLRPLEVIAALAPLLGLFGTVLGMIEAFQALEAAGTQVNPSVLSGGIWVALLTTAVGLAVAMPVTICHSAFERRLELLAAALTNDIEQFFHLAARHGHDATGRLLRHG